MRLHTWCRWARAAVSPPRCERLRSYATLLSECSGPRPYSKGSACLQGMSLPAPSVETALHSAVRQDPVVGCPGYAGGRDYGPSCVRLSFPHYLVVFRRSRFRIVQQPLPSSLESSPVSSVPPLFSPRKKSHNHLGLHIHDNAVLTKPWSSSSRHTGRPCFPYLLTVQGGGGAGPSSGWWDG